MKIPIVYFGNSLEMVSILCDSNSFFLAMWISESKFTEEHDVFLKHHIIKHKYVANIKELEMCVESFDFKEIKLVIMYSFGIIITSNVLDRVDVYNFHPGSLKRNRGRNPIEWSILLGWKKDEMSLHKIDTTIDTGQVISCKEISISYSDTVDDLKRKQAVHSETQGKNSN